MNSRNAVYNTPFLDIHKALWHSKDSKITYTKETWLTFYNLTFPKLVVHGAIILGFFFSSIFNIF